MFVRPPAYSACVCVFVCRKNLILKFRFLKESPMKKTDFLNKFPEKVSFFTYVDLNIPLSLLKKFYVVKLSFYPWHSKPQAG